MWKRKGTGISPGGTSGGTSGSDRSSPWHAVSIVATPASCRTARALRGIRFLSSEAPRLPLPDCGAGAACSCAYKHHGDRRGQPRRAEELTGIRRPVPTAQERRRQRGRRDVDLF
jgi:hypothetical protein